ncbi:hypothetical protein DEJ50_29945 [Streptomyces venezuelae]|uniref:Large secreted protein n=1 Tax=Streptomyces venezuelae TaxID=54571 RepID=A0A5P2DEE2_STRVZ|nr:hypothetical protein DEJ50_29945 [Streptomyces venezuelae]
MDADDTLVAGKDGTIRPRAARLGLALSGGGGSPLARLTKNGREIALTWPGPLPKPVLDGDTATYADVLPGVDLKVIADVDSFSHVLVVKTREAARNPRLSTLSFGIRAKGLKVKAGADGALAAVDPAGHTVFTAPTPKMWDSKRPVTGQASAAADSDTVAATARPSADPAEGAPEAARQAPLGVRLKGETLELTTDRALLTDPGTTFPVIIDPLWRDDWKNAYAIAYKHNAFPNSASTAYWNGGTLSKEARVGCSRDAQNGNAVVCANTFFKIDVSNLWDKHILSSTLRIQQKYAGSWDCKSGAVDIVTSNIPTPQTTWNNQPATFESVASSDVSFGGRNCPTASGDQLIEFDVTSAVAKGAREHWQHGWGFRMSSRTNTVDVSWRKFAPDTARISTNFNTPPGTPADRSTDPSVPCTGGTFGLTDHVTLRARVWDNEDNQVTAIFHYWKDGVYQPIEIRETVVRGNVAAARIPTANLASGTYRWDVTAYDGTSWSPWSGQCLFTIDKTRPSRKPTVSSPQFPNGDTGSPPVSPARTTGDFTFGANGISDVVRYTWHTDTDTAVRSVTAPHPGGSVTIQYKPLNAGPLRMYVTSHDAAGNPSDTTAYLMYAKRSAERDKPGDLNGDGNTDVWAIEKDTGQLKFYPGQGNGEFGLGLDASQATFTDAGITHRGDLGEDGYEDLAVLARGPNGAKELYVMNNRGDGTLQHPDTGRRVLDTYRPEAKVWTDADQILSLGSVNDDTGQEPFSGPDGLIDDYDYADFLIRAGNRLWFFQGSKSAYLDELADPVLVGDEIWAGTTLMTPGDTDGDGLPELWARDEATGDVNEYRSRKDASGNLDISAYGDPATKTRIATGLSLSAYPRLGSNGDFENAATGARHADLWGTDPLGRVMELPGRDRSGGSAFDPARLIVAQTRSWADCEPVSGFSLCGPILSKYKAMGPARLGAPLTGVLTSGDGVGRYADFANHTTLVWGPKTGVWAVGGSIRDKWGALNWERGPLGYPTSDEYDTPDRSGRYNTFQHAQWGAAIYWHPEFGAHSMYGSIYAKYRDAGGFARLGYPTTDETSTPDNAGRFNHFRRPLDRGDTGSIYWKPDLGAKMITGPVRSFWATRGWEAGSLGYPTSDTYALQDGKGQVGYFNYAGVYWSQATGTHKVFGNIFAKYLELGGPEKLGYPENDETATPDTVGRFNSFNKNWAIYWTPSTGAHAVGGAIRDKWAAMGWERGPGYPLTDELPTAGGAGRYNVFSNATSIYWSPSTGAWSVGGDIRTAWVQLGAETGWLGFPTSDEFSVPGGRRSNFQHGWIVWNATTRAITTGTS